MRWLGGGSSSGRLAGRTVGGSSSSCSSRMVLHPGGRL